MSKKVIEAKIKGDNLYVKFNQKQWDLIPDAIATILAAFITLHKQNDYKDYEINNQLKLLIADAWGRSGYKPKDIVEEI